MYTFAEIRRMEDRTQAFNDMCRAIYGTDRWGAKLQRDMEVGHDAVWHWKTGKRQPPLMLMFLLLYMIEDGRPLERVDTLNRAITELHETSGRLLELAKELSAPLDGASLQSGDDDSEILPYAGSPR